MHSDQSIDAMLAMTAACGWASPVTFRDLGDGGVVLEIGCGTSVGPLDGDLPVPDASVDGVVSNCVFSVSPDRSRTFAEIARVLRPGGRLGAVDIVAEDVPDWVRTSHALTDSCVRGAGREADYIAGLRSAGLGQVAVGGRYVHDRGELGRLTFGGPLPLLAEGDIVDALIGRVWSAYFSATKPEEVSK